MEMFSGKFNTRSAGLYNNHPVSADQIEWADTVIVMEEGQRDEIAKRFPKHYMMKKILCLDVPDIYAYNDNKLKEEISQKMTIL
jgi:predicted protein tyrosine phosphatase